MLNLKFTSQLLDALYEELCSQQKNATSFETSSLIDMS